MTGLTRENPKTIAFVLNCYLSNAISTLELQTWAADVAGSGIAYPDYLLDLTTFDAPRFHVYEALGFSPGRTFSAEESDAIHGIAYLRDRKVYEAVDKARALQALQNHPSVRTEFAAVFPFIQSGHQSESVDG
ncbi:hypothetical protein [Pseudomonas reidholzensis]|uniref:hypothetical protein n=1 Tax=Pseudomonas reidholzensis TaxID=1785162 RepID=UPI0011C3C0C9|nr:hypothetical protein [Pseudomonas reidholzensis]